MKFFPRKLFAKTENKIFDRFWENELLNFLKLNLFIFKFKILQKRKKMPSYILPMNIPTDFEINPNIGCRATGVDRQTDRPTDRPTDQRRATAIGLPDLAGDADSKPGTPLSDSGNYFLIFKIIF